MKNEVSSRCYHKGTASDVRTCSTRICPSSFSSNNHRLRATIVDASRNACRADAPSISKLLHCNRCSHFLNPVGWGRFSFIAAILLSFSRCLASSSAVGLSSLYHCMAP